MKAWWANSASPEDAEGGGCLPNWRCAGTYCQRALVSRTFLGRRETCDHSSPHTSSCCIPVSARNLSIRHASGKQSRWPMHLCHCGL
jgi:hypothetical protein